jgi:hypothetical protein
MKAKDTRTPQQCSSLEALIRDYKRKYPGITVLAIATGPTSTRTAPASTSRFAGNGWVTVAISRRLRAERAVNDLAVGDLVRRRFHAGVGLITAASDGWAWVAWGNGRRDYLPFPALRKVAATGHGFDARRK